MIEKIIHQLARDPDFKVVHLPFYFTRSTKEARRPAATKLLELIRVIFRLLKIRKAGPIDVMLFPVGGPQWVPLIRDFCLLPWIRACSRKLILHFHAGGIAERMASYPLPVRAIARYLYSKADAAVVMTEIGREDPKAAGISTTAVIPFRLEDTYESSLAEPKDHESTRLLYVGHLCEEKGTPQLIRAVARLRASGANLQLVLMGETLAPYTKRELDQLITSLQLKGVVEHKGVLQGQAKWAEFANADLFIFPSMAAESFGLVLVEAMMWGLPIIVTDRRGNADVVGRPAGGVCFCPDRDLSRNIEEALTVVLKQPERWPEWGRTNRERFEKRYRAMDGKIAPELTELLRQQAVSP